MVRPARFACNPQTAASNAFQQHPTPVVGNDLQAAALREFDELATALDRAGVEVLVAPDSDQPAKPDAIFPNNWVSFHHDGTVALYPMLAPNRRWERRDEVLEQVVRKGGFRVSRTVDLTHREAEEKYLEGTGSVVLDRVHRMAYACSSPRTDLDVLGEFAQLLDYDLMTFDATDSGGRAIYHTNVLMAIGTGFAVVCGDSIANTAHRTAVFSKLRATGHDVRRYHPRTDGAVRRQRAGIGVAGGEAHCAVDDGLGQLESDATRHFRISRGLGAGVDPHHRTRRRRRGALHAGGNPLAEARYGIRRSSHLSHNRPMLELGVKLLIAYLLGTLLGSLILGRLRGVDIRSMGSGNAGATNAMRTQGKLFGFLVLIIDIAKGMVGGVVAAVGGIAGYRHRSRVCRANG